MTTAISTGGPEGQSMGMRGGVVVASSFGASNTTFGPPGFRAHSFIASPRMRLLSRRESYFKCTHHDHKIFDFDGRMIPPGPPTSQPLLSGAEQFSHYVPLRYRRPSAPYRLARTVVNSFTALLFGHGRWPTVRVHGDPVTEDFAQALAEAANLRTTFIRARAIGGSVGTVGISWRYYDGRPRVQSHNGKHLTVHEWADREALVPAHVTECYTYSRDVWDHARKRNVTKWYWHRQDWTENGDVVFKPVEYDRKADPVFIVDEERSVFHEDGVCHFVWVQNLPDDDETQIDGQPDYAELYEQLEEIDIILSVVTRGAKLNLDPTLVLKLDPDIVGRFGVKKGSDNALIVGTGGSASYMELSGSSITAGTALADTMRESILEGAQCVIPDPNQVGGAGTSSVALKVIYEPMLAKTELLREQYGEGLKRLLTAMVDVARARSGVVDVEVYDGETGERVVDEEGAPMVEPTVEVVDLPPRVVKEIVTDPELGTEEEVVREVERAPGGGGEVELDWGEYFNPTADDKAKAVATLQLATAGKIMSRESAAEEVASMYKRDRSEEQERLDKEAAAVAEVQGGMFPDVGGEVFGPGQLPDGAEPMPAQPGAPLVTDMSKVATVNEARATATPSLPPLAKEDGTPDPDGELTVAEFAAKRAAAAAAHGKAMGAATGVSEAATDPTIIETVASPEKPEGTAAAEGKKGAPITPTDAAKIVKVDEARRASGLDPIGGEDGTMTVAAYSAKQEAQAVETGKLVGQAEGQIEASETAAEGGVPPTPAPEGEAPGG